MADSDSIPWIPPEVLEFVPERIARENLILPAAVEEESITLYCPNSPDFAFAHEEQMQFLFSKRVKWIPVDIRLIREGIDRYFSAAIAGCQPRFKYRCPKTWHSLASTKNEKIRHCSECNQLVYLCESSQESDALRGVRKCIAFDDGISGFLGELA